MRQFSIALLCLLAVACGRPGAQSKLSGADAAFQQRLQEETRSAHPGTVILIPPGRHPLEHALTLQTNGVTLRGAGADSSILIFKDAPAAPAGIQVRGNRFTIDGVTIEDAPGDALVIAGENIIVHGVQVAWTQGPRSGNGAYGIRLEGARNALIEDSTAYAASNAGIYLRQSHNVIVRRCHIEQSVSGITVSDTAGADLEGNLITGNTAGIVIANAPAPANGAAAPTARIFGNKIYKNNLPSFAPAGSPLAGVPQGAGVLVNGPGQIEIFDNEIANNQTANIIISVNFFGAPGRADSSRSIFIHGNRFSGGGNAPVLEDLKALRVKKFGPGGLLPDIVWDGYGGGAGARQRICIDNVPATVLDADAPHDYKDAATDLAPFRCELPKLPAVNLLPN